jgi:hypothetical protein
MVFSEYFALKLDYYGLRRMQKKVATWNDRFVVFDSRCEFTLWTILPFIHVMKILGLLLFGEFGLALWHERYFDFLSLVANKGSEIKCSMLMWVFIFLSIKYL